MAVYLYDPDRTEFEDESSISVSHNFGRRVNIQVSIVDPEDASQYIPCYPKIEHIDLNTSNVSFYEGEALVEKTGFIIIN